MESPEQTQNARRAERLQRFKRSTLEDGTLCSFCNDMCDRPPDTGEPYYLRSLSDLIEAAAFCQYCALWMSSLGASANAVLEAGQDAARKTHPLLQEVLDEKDVILQYISFHDFFKGNMEQRIVWPSMGFIWATLDLVPVQDEWLFNLGPLSESDQTETIWRGIKFWLTNCTTRHAECRRPQTSWRPTRLLQLGSLDEGIDVRLVLEEEISEGAEYLTLSHVWGSHVPLRLTKDNIEALKSHIDVEVLPRTFRDACDVARKLGHQYLWIDTLCIIQDDPKDWAFESGRMGSVYRNSFLNIAATAANNSDEGLFHQDSQRDRNCWLPVRVHRKWQGPFVGDYFVTNYRDWSTKLNRSPLNRRAWVSQERALAPRVLHFGLEQVAFECSEMAACERLPYGDISHVDGYVSGSRNQLKMFIASNWDEGEVPEVWDVLQRWNEIVRDYSQGQLTFDTDKMVALTATADVFARNFERSLRQRERRPQVEDAGAGESDGGDPETDGRSNSETSSPTQNLFVAGLWKPDLELQLAWRAVSQVQNHQMSGNAPSAHGHRPSTYIAPTWSWCSLKDVLIEPEQSNPFDIGLTKVLEAEIKRVEGVHTSQANHGLKYCCAPGSYIRLRCSLLPIIGCGETRTLVLPSFDGGNPVEVKSHNYWDAAFEEEATKAQMPCIVPTFVDMLRATRPIHGIILDRRKEDGEDGKQYFVRLGAFVLNEPRDVDTFWDAVAKFDHANPGTEGGAGTFYGVYRPVPDKREYEKKDGVLQRTIDIR